MPYRKHSPSPLVFLSAWNMNARQFLHTAQGKCKHTDGPTLLLSLKYSTGKQHYMSAGYTNLCTNEERCTNPKMMAQHGVTTLWKQGCTPVTVHTSSVRHQHTQCYTMRTQRIFFRAFSSLVRQLPEYNSYRRDTPLTLPNYTIIFTWLVQR
jgi:hypothetical protein